MSFYPPRGRNNVNREVEVDDARGGRAPRALPFNGNWDRVKSAQALFG